MDFADFIREKGVNTISGVLNVALATTYQWVSRNHIPRERWPDLMLAYPELGLLALISMETKSKERA